jgi:hypothetical protein
LALVVPSKSHENTQIAARSVTVIKASCRRLNGREPRPVCVFEANRDSAKVFGYIASRIGAD